MITPERKNPILFARSLRETLEQRTDLTSFSGDSKSRVMIDLIANQFTESRSEMIRALQSNQIGTAIGENLDALGVTLGVERLRASQATVSAAERSLAFYVASGTFGDINSGSNITVPIGTYVYTNANENDANSVIRYKLTAPCVCSAGSSTAFASAIAEFSGTSHNLGPGLLQHHSQGNVNLLVTNIYAILNGRNEETDDVYRFRLATNYDRLISMNENKIRLAALGVPGVINIVTLPGYYGIGTAAVAVLGADYRSNAKLLDGVQARINAVKAPGAVITAIPAELVYFDFELEVRTAKPLSAADRNRFRAELRLTLFNYLRNITIGSSVSLADIVAAVKSKIPIVYRARSDLFKNVYIRTGSGEEISERDALILDSYTLGQIQYPDLGTLSIEFKT